MTSELVVWLFNEKVGILRLEKGRLSFAYTKEYLARSNVISLSASLPLQDKPFDDLQTRPFFSGLLPEGRMRNLIAQQFQVSDQKVIEILNELPRRPMLAGEDGLRLSLAGAQDKLPVVFEGNRIGLPKNGTPSTHILKPAIHAVEDSVTNEGFCLGLAQSMNLSPVRSKIQHVLGRSFLLVERYDRIVDVNKGLLRVHQEDFCQLTFKT